MPKVDAGFTAMVFAAGLGTRLRPITDSLPKALVPVGGVPMLARVLGKLRDAGAGCCVVNACHFAPMIVSYLKDNDFGLPVKLSVEEGGMPLETGGGIKHARALLEGCCGNDGRFLVHNVDILSNLDVRWFISQDRKESLATLLLTRKKADRYLLFDDEMCLRGWMNERTGEVKSPDPFFDPSSFHRYSFCGVHMISGRVFKLMESWPDNFGIIDFYLSVCENYTIRGVVAEDLDLIDIGSPATLEAANKLFH